MRALALPHMPPSSFKRVLLTLALFLVSLPAFADEIPLADRKSGYEFMGRETRAMQDDDTANPGMLSVLDGEALWNRKAGTENKSCADCHQNATASMKGVAAGYPLYRLEWQSLGSLQRRLRNCIVGMRVEPYAFGAPEYVDLELYLMWRARGLKIETPAVRP